MFKKTAKLEFKKIYASDNNGNYYWRDFVKQANTQLATDSNFVPKNFYEYNTDKFLYLTARAISSLESWGPNGNFDAFPWEELKKSYPTFCGKGFYIEHKEDDENDAKGIILDAQPDEDNEFINCICAISKEEYPEICDDILNGRLNQVSMSCLASSCECSRCHNVATKEEELCEHMNPEHPHFCKGSLDENNKPIYEINRDIVFTGLSGVAIPADKDAFIFDIKASKKQRTTIDKEYNKYLRAKKEYEYINSLLEKEDIRKYIESQLKKAFEDIKGKSWEDVLNKISELGYEFDEHYYDEPYKFITVLKDNKEYKIKLFGYNNGSYEVISIVDTGKTYKDLDDFLLNSSLKKKAGKFNLSKETIKGMVIDALDLLKSEHTMYNKQFNTDDEVLKVQLEQRDKEHEFFKKWRGYDYGNFVNRHNDTFHKLYTNQISIEQAVEQVKALEDQIHNYDSLNPHKKANLKKKADIEYFSDKVQEIPEIDFYTEFMNAGKSKGNSEEINKEQLEMGKKVEMEHTTNPIIAEKIAMDHIKEIPNYYNLLAEMEASAKANYEVAKQEINKEINEEYPTKQASKQFFKIKKASWEVKKDKDNKYHILTPDGKYKNSKGEIYKFDTEKDALEEMEYLKAEHKYENKKQASKQFFKIKKVSKKWFKIASVYDDPEDRNEIDEYGLNQLERETLADVVWNINRVNEESYITWEELIESIPTDIISYDFMNKNKDKIIEFIQNELEQDIEVY